MDEDLEDVSEDYHECYVVSRDATNDRMAPMIEKAYLIDMIEQKLKKSNKAELDDETSYWIGYQEAMFEIIRLIK